MDSFAQTIGYLVIGLAAVGLLAYFGAQSEQGRKVQEKEHRIQFLVGARELYRACSSEDCRRAVRTHFWGPDEALESDEEMSKWVATWSDEEKLMYKRALNDHENGLVGLEWRNGVISARSS